MEGRKERKKKEKEKRGKEEKVSQNKMDVKKGKEGKQTRNKGENRVKDRNTIVTVNEPNSLNGHMDSQTNRNTMVAMDPNFLSDRDGTVLPCSRTASP